MSQLANRNLASCFINAIVLATIHPNNIQFTETEYNFNLLKQIVSQDLSTWCQKFFGTEPNNKQDIMARLTGTKKNQGLPSLVPTKGLVTQKPSPSYAKSDGTIMAIKKSANQTTQSKTQRNSIVKKAVIKKQMQAVDTAPRQTQTGIQQAVTKTHKDIQHGASFRHESPENNHPQISQYTLNRTGEWVSELSQKRYSAESKQTKTGQTITYRRKEGFFRGL